MARRKVIKIPGPFHDVKLFLRTKKFIHGKFFETSGVELHGCFVPDDNEIYIASDLPEDQKLHVLFHELIHMVIYATDRLDEEGKADALGAYFMKLSGAKTLQEFIDRIEVKK